MSDTLEIEAKFEVDSNAWEQLRDRVCFGDFALVQRINKQQDDRYYDTRDGRLKAAGASLRIRRARLRTEMTFKGERTAVSPGHDNLVSRLEDEVEISDDTITHLGDKTALRIQPEPSPLRRSRELAGNEDLFPTARLRTDRTTLTFENGSGDRVEIALDCCLATRLSDDREVRFIEVEVELKRGGPSALALALDGLHEVVHGLVPSIRTKLERALEG